MAVVGCAGGAARKTAAERQMTVAFSDPSQPRKLVVDTMFGSVTVRGYDGQDAIVESTGASGSGRGGAGKRSLPAGMHRIGGSSAGSRSPKRTTPSG